MIAPLYQAETPWAMCWRLAARAARRYALAQDGADIAQEALCHYYSALGRGRSVRVPEAYLRRIVERCTIDRWRAYRCEPIPVELREDDTVVRARGPSTGPQDHADADQRMDLDELVERLPRRERDAVLAVRTGVPLQQLAQADGVSLRSVQRRVQRAVRRMRATVAET